MMDNDHHKGGCTRRCPRPATGNKLLAVVGLATAVLDVTAQLLRPTGRRHIQDPTCIIRPHGVANMSTWEAPVMKAHVSRVQLWMPSAIHSIATHPDTRTLAVGREDGDVELTVPSEGYRVESRVPGLKGKGLRSLVWMEGNASISNGSDGVEQSGTTREPARLFGCGLDGTVFEIDTAKLCYKNVRDAYGGAAWCMRASSSSSALLAVGCEDGSVRLFTTEDGGLEYKRTIPSTGSRVLSVAWGPGDAVIFAGCADSLIHCYDAASGQSLFDMRLESEAKGQQALVWALEALEDGTVISGDSYGRVEIWDGLTGTQLQSLATHEADILCLCSAEGQTEVFASGCDGKVVLLERLQPSLEGDDGDVKDDAMNGSSGAKPPRTPRQAWEWSIGKMVRSHTHDVHALAIHGQTLKGTFADGVVGAARKGAVLVSGGVDASLSLYSVPGFKTQGPHVIEPLPPVPVAFLAPAPRLVLVMANLHVDLWELPQRSETAGINEVEEDPHLVLRLKPKSEKGGHLACAALSADGRLLAVSNTRGTKLYRIKQSSSRVEPLSAKRVRLPGDCAPPAHALAFSADGRTLVVAAAAGDIRIVELEGKSQSGGEDRSDALAGIGSAPRLMHCFEEHVDGIRLGGSSASRDEGAVPISAVTLSACGKWMASASVSGVVHVFDMATLRYHWTLPSFSDERCVGLRFHCRHAVLACVDSSNALRLMDVPKRRLAECHDYAEFPRPPTGRGAWGGRGNVQPLSGVAFSPEDQLYTMLLFNHRSVMYVTPQRKVPKKVLVEHPRLSGVPSKARESKKRRICEGTSDNDQTQATLPSRTTSNFKMKQDFSSVVLMDFLSKNEVLIMENPWNSVRESLPDVLDRKQYGV